MADIIQLLPDSVANQIAAGEVIQRPASVIKELVENAVDAGSTSVKVNIKDAGKTLIQIIDNGYGMSETDARLAFERHATSKIKSANDLFSIRTMGFRGEALASIAAIANVELKTKKPENELGTLINISGSEVETQEPVACPDGSNFCIKNLFYNVPARRKFLKANSTELKHIITEFQRIALCNHEVAFHLQHNDTEIYNLPATTIQQRIVNLFGKNIKQNLISVDTGTTLINISGFIGKPEFAKKTSGEQYFFVNNRFMRHPYFYKAVLQAYDQILPLDTVPSFFLFFDVDPTTIDINIHPTKTEIKFEDERAIWQIIRAAVKESLGKFSVTPSIDFEIEHQVDIPVPSSANKEFSEPMIEVNRDYNPFEVKRTTSYNPSAPRAPRGKENLNNWEDLYNDFESDSHKQQSFFPEEEQSPVVESTPEQGSSSANIFQIKNRYILTPVKSGLMVIDQKRAHERILFERFVDTLNTNTGIAQQSLFPQTVELTPADFALLQGIMEDIRLLGFDIEVFGKSSIVINGTPANINNADAQSLIESFLEDYKTKSVDVNMAAKEKLAYSLAKASAINYGKALSNQEMREIIDTLFACQMPNYTPNGKLIVSILNSEELEKRF